MQNETRSPSSIPIIPGDGPPRFDPRDLRRALGAFATGVTVVTTLGPGGRPVGFTANSFTSVSLEPPLVLVCLAKSARSYAVFAAAERFAVNILAEDQRETSNSFATAGADKFARVSWRSETSGAPVLEGVSAWFDCLSHARIDGGDHLILLGRVSAYAHTTRPPLGYCNGAYINLTMTAAVDAAADDAPLRVGAIVERDGEVLFKQDPSTGSLWLPAARRMGHAQDADGLLGLLARAGVAARPSFVYSVFEHAAKQAIYYRAAARGRSAPSDPAFAFRPLDEETLAGVKDNAVRSMLTRYRDERRQDLFGVYVGTEEAGDVRPIGKGDRP